MRNVSSANSGKYTVTVQNEVGTKTANFIINVQGECDDLLEPLSLIMIRVIRIQYSFLLFGHLSEMTL